VNDLTGRSYRQFLQNGVVFGAAGRLEEGLIAGLTLTEHMALVKGESAIIDWPTITANTQQYINHYKVRGRPNDQIEQLSGGNQQRVLMALLPETPCVLFLEQPTRGLDVDSARWIWQQLLERRERGTAIVFSSPELDELVAYSDRILVFYAGRIHEVTDVANTTIDQLGHLIGGEFDWLAV
jgi:simple sugar transport system ATP-binding protein